MLSVYKYECYISFYLVDSGHRSIKIDEEDDGYSNLLISVLGAPFVISVFLFGLILHDRLQKSARGANNTTDEINKMKEAMKDTKYQALPCNEKYKDELLSDTDESNDDVIFDVKS